MLVSVYIIQRQIVLSGTVEYATRAMLTRFIHLAGQHAGSIAVSVYALAIAEQGVFE